MAVAALDAVVAFAALFLFELALALDREGVVFDANVDFFLIDIRQVRLKHQVVLRFENIDGGRPRPVGAGFAKHAGECVFENAEIG